MTSLNQITQHYFDDVDEIKSIFKSALSSSIVKSDELPLIPREITLPIPSPFLTKIKKGVFSHRIKSFSTTDYFEKRRDSLCFYDKEGEFTEIIESDLTKEETYIYCRSVIFTFSDEVKSIIKQHGKIFLWANFNSFDLKIGIDISKEIVILSPLEYKQLESEIAEISAWNRQILKINKIYARLKYRLSELAK